MSAVNHACFCIDGGVAVHICVGALNVISTSNLTPKAAKVTKLSTNNFLEK
jgi:hypothetical protein